MSGVFNANPAGVVVVSSVVIVNYRMNTTRANRLAASTILGILLLVMSAVVCGSRFVVAQTEQPRAPVSAPARSVVFPRDEAVGVYSLIENWTTGRIRTLAQSMVNLALQALASAQS